MKHILVISALSLTLLACAGNSGSPGGSSSGSAAATQVTKDLYSEWASQIAAPSIYLGFNTPQLDPQNIAVMYLDLTDYKNTATIDVFIGPGVDSLGCYFLATMTGDGTSGTIQPTSFTTTTQDTNTPDALTIQQNLHDYCNSLVGIYTFTINNNKLTLCPQGAPSDACTRFQ